MVGWGAPREARTLRAHPPARPDADLDVGGVGAHGFLVRISSMAPADDLAAADPRQPVGSKASSRDSQTRSYPIRM